MTSMEHGDPRDLLSVMDVMARTGIGRTTVYRLIAERQIAARKIGRRTVIPRRALEAYIDALPPV